MSLHHRIPHEHNGLRPGMKLLCPVGAQFADRVQLSTGVLPAAETSFADTYSRGSFVPRPPWRLPSCHERALLFGTPAPAALPGEWIAVFPVPARVLDAFTELRAAAVRGNEAAVRSSIAGPAGRIGLVEMLRWANTLTDPDRPEIDAPLLYGKTPVGNPTMTTGSHGLRVGLHVDSWYRSPLAERAAAPNRLSVNLGQHDRCLLCVNAPLHVMEQVLREGNMLEGADNPRYALGKRFMEMFPRYPVTKVTIHPGEAYIAPTENVLHDGYAQPHGQIDLQFNCRGYFSADRAPLLPCGP
ncbi:MULTISPECIES: hypothetical protein [unclassified Nocardia]|uniref:hypothetical protein n=1 Tax=unclassified Nocardia TaxID=2637762 RepID=UPI001CE3EC7D|nr:MULTISPECIES: hypothetical protein [unclassified Nocardia]